MTLHQWLLHAGSTVRRLFDFCEFPFKVINHKIQGGTSGRGPECSTMLPRQSSPILISPDIMKKNFNYFNYDGMQYGVKRKVSLKCKNQKMACKVAQKLTKNMKQCPSLEEHIKSKSTNPVHDHHPHPVFCPPLKNVSQVKKVGGKTQPCTHIAPISQVVQDHFPSLVQ